MLKDFNAGFIDISGKWSIRCFMKKYLLLIILVLFSVSAVSQVENEIFSDNFEGYQDGSDGSPVWNITKGDWITKDGMFYQKSLEYDCGAMLDLFIDYSFVFEVDIKWVKGEPGAGFFFYSRAFPFSLTFSFYSFFWNCCFFRSSFFSFINTWGFFIGTAALFPRSLFFICQLGAPQQLLLYTK